MMETAVVLLVFVIAIQLRAIREVLKRNPSVEPAASTSAGTIRCAGR